MAPRSSRIASAVRKIFSEVGTRDPRTARTPSAKAMSVAAGIAQPRSQSGVAPRHCQIDEGRNHHAAQGRDAWQGAPRPGGQLAVEKFAFDLDARRAERTPPSGASLIQCRTLRPRTYVPSAAKYVLRERRVGDGQRQDGDDHQHDAASGLAVEEPAHGRPAPLDVLRLHSRLPLASAVSTGDGWAGIGPGDLAPLTSPRGRGLADAIPTAG